MDSLFCVENYLLRMYVYALQEGPTIFEKIYYHDISPLTQTVIVVVSNLFR